MGSNRFAPEHTRNQTFFKDHGLCRLQLERLRTNWISKKGGKLFMASVTRRSLMRNRSFYALHWAMQFLQDVAPCHHSKIRSSHHGSGSGPTSAGKQPWSKSHWKWLGLDEGSASGHQGHLHLSTPYGDSLAVDPQDDSDYLKALVDSMPRRLQAMPENGSNAT